MLFHQPPAWVRDLGHGAGRRRSLMLFSSRSAPRRARRTIPGRPRQEIVIDLLALLGSGPCSTRTSSHEQWRVGASTAVDGAVRGRVARPAIGPKAGRRAEDRTTGREAGRPAAWAGRRRDDRSPTREPDAQRRRGDWHETQDAVLHDLPRIHVRTVFWRTSRGAPATSRSSQGESRRAQVRAGS